MTPDARALDPVRQICGVDFVFTDYKEPLVQLKGAVKGYMRGTLPYALADGRLPCAFCDPSKKHASSSTRPGSSKRDNLFDDLSKHVRPAHGHSAQQYREDIGLMRSTRLVSRRVRVAGSASARARGLGRCDIWRLSQTASSVAKRNARSHERSLAPESLNKRGVCPDQVRAVATSLARANGGVLRNADLMRQGVYAWTLRRNGWSGIRALALEIGAKYVNTRWTDAEMLRAFRELAGSLGRTPRAGDLGHANGTPSHPTYYEKFGSLTEVARLCGLPPNLPRPVREGDEIDMLNQFAVLGGILRAARACHFPERSVRSVLAKYGVPILPNGVGSRHPEAERAKARAWAAEIAQRLAS